MTLMSPNGMVVLLAIAGAAVVTYSLRFGGLMLAERMPRSAAFRSFMEALPGTILVALVAPGIVSAGWLGWGGAFLTALCMYKTKNVLLSMLAGMVIVAAGRAVV